MGGLAALLVLLASAPVFATSPVAYSAQYKLRAYGLKAVLSVEQRPDPDAAEAQGAVWRYRSEIKAKGIGKLFLGGTTFEDVVFELRDDGRVRRQVRREVFLLLEARLSGKNRS
ncbi:MAG: hypothetical protein AAFX85_14915 [Pseudomonadota bacterium]